MGSDVAIALGLSKSHPEPVLAGAGVSGTRGEGVDREPKFGVPGQVRRTTSEAGYIRVTRNVSVREGILELVLEVCDGIIVYGVPMWFLCIW